MLNLLIREDRHWLRKEYLLRFVLVFIFFLVVSMFIWSVVIASFYIQVQVEQRIVKDELESVKASSDSKNINEALDLNSVIRGKIREFNILNFEQSGILLEVVSKQQDGISISLISNDLIYQIADAKKEITAGVFGQIEIRGLANNRSNLVSYQEKLASSSIFDSVDIPFSSFAQNSDIPFTVRIKTVELNSYFEELEKTKEIESSISESISSEELEVVTDGEESEESIGPDVVEDTEDGDSAETSTSTSEDNLENNEN